MSLLVLETWSDLQRAMSGGVDWRYHVRAQLEEHGIDGRPAEVCWELLKGKTNKEIANALYINEQTVKNHMTTIYAALRVEDRTQAILVLLGVIEPTISVRDESISAFAVDRKQGIGVRHGFST